MQGRVWYREGSGRWCQRGRVEGAVWLGRDKGGGMRWGKPKMITSSGQILLMMGLDRLCNAHLRTWLGTIFIIVTFKILKFLENFKYLPEIAQQN